MGNLATKVGDYITMDGTPCNCKGSFILSKEAHPFRGGSVRRYSATDFDVVDYDVFRKAYEKV